MRIEHRTFTKNGRKVSKTVALVSPAEFSGGMNRTIRRCRTRFASRTMSRTVLTTRDGYSRGSITTRLQGENRYSNIQIFLKDTRYSYAPGEYRTGATNKDSRYWPVDELGEPVDIVAVNSLYAPDDEIPRIVTDWRRAMLGDINIEHRYKPTGEEYAIALVECRHVDGDEWADSGSELIDLLWLRRQIIRPFVLDMVAREIPIEWLYARCIHDGLYSRLEGYGVWFPWDHGLRKAMRFPTDELGHECEFVFGIPPKD